jgi:hypothetical protein
MCDAFTVALIYYDSKSNSLVSRQISGAWIFSLYEIYGSSFEIFVTEFSLQLFQIVRKEGKEIITSVGGYQDKFLNAKQMSLMTKDEKSREKFYREIQSVVDKFSLTGVLFQWFYPGCADPVRKIIFFYCQRLQFVC